MKTSTFARSSACASTKHYPAISYLYDPVVQDAEYVARREHTAISHRRPVTHEPYVNHLSWVVEAVASVEHTPHMLAAAWMHDITDTKFTLDQVRARFGPVIYSYVRLLSPNPAHATLLRAQRMAMFRERLRETAPPAVHTVKAADILHNLLTVTCLPERFARLYVSEKIRELQALTRADTIILNRARAALEVAAQQLSVPLPEIYIR